MFVCSSEPAGTLKRSYHMIFSLSLYFPHLMNYKKSSFACLFLYPSDLIKLFLQIIFNILFFIKKEVLISQNYGMLHQYLLSYNFNIKEVKKKQTIIIQNSRQTDHKT